MNTKEKILAEFKERLGHAANAKFAYRQLEQILASLPTEKEITLRGIDEYLNYLRDEKGIMIVPEEDCINIRSIRDYFLYK